MASEIVEEVYVPQTMELEEKDKVKFQADVKKIKKIRKKRREPESPRGVVYLGHIPPGFYEPQMKKFFGQFGHVTRVRMSRSKKTGRSKGFAFIEFKHKEVAEVVAATMNNYLMFMRLLKCEFMPAEKVHPKLFDGCQKKFAVPKAAAVAAARHDGAKTKEQQKQRQSKQRRKSKKTLQKLAELGIQYSLEENQQTEPAEQSPIPDMVRTPKGKFQVLKEDAADAEVTFKTPPGAIKSSRLSMTPKVIKLRSQRQKKIKRLK